VKIYNLHGYKIEYNFTPFSPQINDIEQNRLRIGSKFGLGRQNQLEYLSLQLGEIGRWITPKAVTKRVLLATGLQCLTEFLPGTEVSGGEFLTSEGAQPRGSPGLEPDCATRRCLTGVDVLLSTSVSATDYPQRD
jgi:hypothetical protein